MKAQSILKTVLLAAGFSAFTLIGSAQAQVMLTGGDSTDGWVAPAPANSVLAYNLNDGGIQKQFRGESCEPISLSYSIVTHNNPNK